MRDEPEITFAPVDQVGHVYNVVDRTITEDGKFLATIPVGPLPVSFFQALPKGTEIRLFYWSTNRGDFVWRHDHVEEKDVGASSFRVYGSFFHDGRDEWVPVDDYLYEFMGAICRGSGAEPVHAFEPDEPDE